MPLRSITTFLWFDGVALEAAEFYVSLFPDAVLGDVSYYTRDAQQPQGEVLTVAFSLFGQPYVALNGGPGFPHSEAVSFQVACDDQDDVDRLWDALIANGGGESRCGWCYDRFGVRWQVIPRQLGELLSSADPEISGYAFSQMMTMGKIVVADLLRPAS
jgi:2-polyprenyl-6-hydroxyphenyl methylase/3-demethylubiquinone-9 3-methyltransferase